ncbi:exported protein [hydrothermal vent metagenome]|uniref:Exported protein n=1 Tax=hydrothermal vent metagenome TaxID=652676 RepID=A0A3B0RR07_9ZZZZ
MAFLNRLSIVGTAVLCCANLSSCYAQNDTGAQNSPVQSQISEAGLKLTQLTIRSGKKAHEFSVEIARSQEEQAKGLMFRTTLLPDRGMIFPFPEDKIASFWMRNTVIPLDIIFIRRNGTIESIAANTTPYSLEPVTSGGKVASVLELAGGRAAELNLNPGDKVSWQE